MTHPILDPKRTPFQQVIDALLDEGHTLAPNNLYRLSGLDKTESEQLAKHWADIPLLRRRAAMEDLESFANTDPLLCFESVARIGLKDSDPGVRLCAIRLLGDEESPGLENILLDMLESDEDERVRAGAGSAIGRYVYLGECDEIPQQTLKTIEDRLLQTVRGNDHPLVRRRALEALGFSGRAEVPVLIEDAFTSEDDEWVASALLAMGRSIDKRWGGDVLEVLNSSSPLVRMEAARAAGELEIEKAVSFLFVLLDDADSGVRGAAIWSLSQIGGEGVTGALEEMLENTGDSGEAALLETALDNLVFTEEFRSLLKPLTLHPLPAYRGG